MKTKLSILLLAGVFLLAAKAQAEIKTVAVNSVVREATIELKKGETGKVLFCTLIHFEGSNNSTSSASIEIDKDDIIIPISAPSSIYRDHVPNISNTFYPVVSGPAKIKLLYKNKNSIMSVEINSNNTANAKSAGHALVLPEGEDGKQKLVLESSTDLVNWTEDSLGSKDSSDKKRFYRLRGVKE